jgi:RHS repeat-associated protein
MNSYAAISSIGFGETLPVHPYIPHSKILRKSLIGVPCSVFNPLQRSLIGVPCSVFIPLQRSLIGVPCSVFSSHIHHTDPEPNWYIYHSDHLGSSAFLTDASGDPTQHLQYMPFGETFVEQRSITSYYTPYTFSAKERDTETGYSYFGARYYDADISVWLSVDPMADKYPSMSAYIYCAGNPVKLIDPDGREIVITDLPRGQTGNQVSVTYYPGMLIPAGHENSFIGQTILALNYIHQNADPTSRVVFEFFANYYGVDGHDVTIYPWPNMCNGAASPQIEYDAFCGSITNGQNPITGETNIPPASTLFHEMVHRYFLQTADIMHAQLLNSVGNGIIQANSPEFNSIMSQINTLWETFGNENTIIEFENNFACFQGWGQRHGTMTSSGYSPPHESSIIGTYTPTSSISIQVNYE